MDDTTNLRLLNLFSYVVSVILNEYSVFDIVVNFMCPSE